MLYVLKLYKLQDAGGSLIKNYCHPFLAPDMVWGATVQFILTYSTLRPLVCDFSNFEARVHVIIFFVGWGVCHVQLKHWQYLRCILLLGCGAIIVLCGPNFMWDSSVQSWWILSRFAGFHANIVSIYLLAKYHGKIWFSNNDDSYKEKKKLECKSVRNLEA